MKVWQEEIRVNGTIDELCQLMDDLISRHECKIYDYDMERTEGDALYVRFIAPPGFIPHDPAYDPTQHVPSGISAFSRGGQTFLRVQPDEYGYWDELYQAMQRYGWLDEQPPQVNADSGLPADLAGLTTFELRAGVTADDVAAEVENNLDCLKHCTWIRKDQTRQKRYEVYKAGEPLGIYTVSWDASGKVRHKPLEYSDDPDLRREWDHYAWNMIWVSVLRKFGQIGEGDGLQSKADELIALTEAEKRVKEKYGNITPKRVEAMEETIEAERLQAQGLSVAIIAERLNIDADTARRRLGKKK